MNLTGTGKVGAHAVASGHDLREKRGTLEVWQNEPEAADTGLHDHVRGELLQLRDIVFKGAGGRPRRGGEERGGGGEGEELISHEAGWRNSVQCRIREHTSQCPSRWPR